MGTPDFSVPTLSAIVGTNHEVVAVYSQPPRPAGRGMAPRPSPVHTFAEGAGIPVFTPANLRAPRKQEVFREHNADAAVVVAYGLILPKAILDAPRFGCYNLHASELPRWRGAAPIQRAIMAGDTQTAVMVMHMDEGLDTGPVCLSETVAIAPDMTAGELHDALARVGAGLVVRALEALEHGTLSETQQSSTGISYASKIDKAEAKIDFSKPAATIHNLVRGLSPFPGAWFEHTTDGKSERIKVLNSAIVEMNGLPTGTPGEVLDHATPPVISCGEGAIRLVTVQRAGKRPCSAEDFLRGRGLPPGTKLG